MSVITEVVNPADDSVALKAKGVVKRIFIKRINADGSPKVTNITKGPNKGKSISSTHRYSILLTAGGVDEFVSFGEGEVKNLKYENQFQVKTDDGYKDLLPGAEISVYPVDKQEYQKDGETKVSYQGKRKNIKILADAPAGAVGQQVGAPTQSGGKGAKIYGEVTAIEGNLATVNDEKNGPGNVVLSDEQLAQVQVGGRLTAFVNMADGTILNGFKAYGPAGQGTGTGGKKSGGNYDPIGVACGHGINGLKELMGAGYKVKDELETVKAIHRATVDMKAFVAERTGKDVESNAVGASAGNAILVACSRFNAKSEVTEATILESAKNVYVTLSEPFYEFLTNEGKPADQTPPQASQEPLSGTVDVPPMDAYDPPMDFDDDIPF